MLIARLIADPAVTDTSLEARLDAVSAALEAEGLKLASVALLESCSDVLELSFNSDDVAALRRVLDAQFPNSDALITRDEFRIPGLFVSDMDSTMIGQECIDELGDFAGLKEKIADITERAMQGELDFESALRERVGLLAQLDEGAIATCLEERIVPMPGARVLVSTLKKAGCRTVLVTGGFHHFADPVAEQLGFERVVGNRLDVADGKLTGGLVGGIVDSSVKKTVLLEELGALGDVATLATGDGANDIPMIEVATYGMAYHAKPKARSAANGWIDHGDLLNVLKLLGIPQSEWVLD